MLEIIVFDVLGALATLLDIVWIGLELLDLFWTRDLAIPLFSSLMTSPFLAQFLGRVGESSVPDFGAVLFARFLDHLAASSRLGHDILLEKPPFPAQFLGLVGVYSALGNGKVLLGLIPAVLLPIRATTLLPSWRLTEPLWLVVLQQNPVEQGTSSATWRISGDFMLKACWIFSAAPRRARRTVMRRTVLSRLGPPA